MTAATRETLTSWVLRALDTVVDPELDEPITELGFVERAEVTLADAGHHVDVALRLPTYFCAPNFAYLMVADAHDAVAAVPGVASVNVQLRDHFAAGEINAGVAADAGFSGSFPGEAGGELDELRRTFRRKAHTACIERAWRRLLADGWQIDALADVQLSDLPPSPERASLLRRRDELGLPTSPDSKLLVDDDGKPVPAEQAPARLRFAQAVRVSIDGNAHFCRGLLHTRYPETRQEVAG